MIKEWTQKDWIARRDVLAARIAGIEFLRRSSIKRFDDMVAIEGGALPLGVREDGIVFVWRTAKRYSGSNVPIGELIKAESAITEWFKEQQ